ncbi:Hint domain-containing protein [Pseudorhodobacter sp.]|uniref:Hint domain-containing protein n=1 Tax=Pseudorhodobacter sp. TaxID=1934400 RepID=UPI002648C5C9|nr:Hint domain-containing protein [Pseudorhodobacter sp.]MDN5788942.1 Hint domain-containing protein [Pseudorhodobacter sp.]
MTHNASDRTTALTEGLVAGTTVLTLAGEMAVEYLSVGDRIITRAGARVLRSVHSTVLPTAKLVCISASALGVDQPAADMCVAPDQGIHIRDWRAKALKGVAQAVIAAKELADGEYIRIETVVGACVYRLEFDQAEVLYANGVEVTCTPATVAATVIAA